MNEIDQHNFIGQLLRTGHCAGCWKCNSEQQDTATAGVRCEFQVNRHRLHGVISKMKTKNLGALNNNK